MNLTVDLKNDYSSKQSKNLCGLKERTSVCKRTAKLIEFNLSTRYSNYF